MYLGRAIGDAEGDGGEQHRRERHLVRDTEGPVQVHRAQHCGLVDPGCGHLDTGDLPSRVLGSHLVDAPGCVQHLEAELAEMLKKIGLPLLRIAFRYWSVCGVS